MSSKNTLLNIFLIIVGVGSFSYIMIGNLNQIKQYNSQMENATALLNSRKGTHVVRDKRADIEHYTDIYRLTDETARQVKLTIDPFAEIEELPDFKLTGMIYDNGRPYAVINDQVITTGEYIQKFRVLEVNDDFVKLSDGEYYIELKLYLPPSEELSPSP